MIIQPYVENAILHGMAHKKSRGQISIRITPDGAGLECRVEDDGVGRQKAAELCSKTVLPHKSMGLAVTQERLNLLSPRDDKETQLHQVFARLAEYFQVRIGKASQVGVDRREVR